MGFTIQKIINMKKFYFICVILLSFHGAIAQKTGSSVTSSDDENFRSRLLVLDPIKVFESPFFDYQGQDKKVVHDMSSEERLRCLTSLKTKHNPKSDTTFFVFDDGSAENGWGISPGFIGWLGNLFPVLDTLSGVLTSFDLYFQTDASGTNQQLTIDVFDSTFQLLGSSALFMVYGDTWLSVPANNIPFSGKFYAMVKWNMLPNPTHLFGYDENGPNAVQDLERYYNGTTWTKLSILGYNPGVFLFRVHATLNTGVGIDEIQQPIEPLIFPNPATGKITIETIIKGSLAILNLNGQQLIRRQITEKQTVIDVAGLPKGVYFVRLTNDKRMQMGKFVKQ
jgi:hypothetical protein